MSGWLAAFRVRSLDARSALEALKRDNLEAGSRGCTPFRPGSILKDSNRFAELGMPLGKNRSSRVFVVEIFEDRTFAEGLKNT